MVEFGIHHRMDFTGLEVVGEGSYLQLITLLLNKIVTPHKYLQNSIHRTCIY